MKKMSYRVKSSKRCRDCGSLMKANLVYRRPKADRCFACHCLEETKRGHLIKDRPRTAFAFIHKDGNPRAMGSMPKVSR